MWGRLGPRFAVEAAFLILLAVGLGLADQSWVVIVAVMAAGWAVVSLIELVASRRAATQWTYPSREPAEEFPAEPQVPELPPAPMLPIDAPAAPSAPAPGPAPMPAEPAEPPETAPAAAGEETMEVPAPELPEDEQPRRRWFRRRRRSVDESDDFVPEPMKHVRRLDSEHVEEPSHAESAEHRS
jgi:hypothetical protein